MNETVAPGAVANAQPASSPPPPPAPRRYRLGRLLLILAVAAALVALGLHFENIGPSTLDATKTAAAAGPPPQTVRAIEVTTGDMPITLDALGAVTPLATVTVKSQIAGKLLNVGFTEGQTVKAGDFLAQIDSAPYEAALAQAQGALDKDTAYYQQAQTDLVRYQTLKQQDSIARQQVDDQVFVVAQYKGAMGTDQAQIDAAKVNIAYTRIVSPINGRVGLRLVDPGNYVTAGDATGIVVITQIDPISVVFSTAEDNLTRITRRLNAGAKMSVTAFDRANVRQLAVGELTTFDNQIDMTTGTFKLRATFANADSALFPNQFVNVRLLIDTLKGVVVAPNAGVQLGAQGSFVYVLKDDNTVSVRKVTTGASDATRTVIASGLAAGEKIVVDGTDRLRDGAKVKLAPPVAAAGAAAPAGDAPSGQGQQRRHRQGDAAGAPTPAPTPAQ